MIRSPKYESERSIHLPDELVAILSEHVRQHTPEREPSRWLFGENGKPWHDNLADYRWRSTRTDAEVSFTLHELRHHFASGLIAAGCDVLTVQRGIGHASATTTLSAYAHLWPTPRAKRGRQPPAWRRQFLPRICHARRSNTPLNCRNRTDQ